MIEEREFFRLVKEVKECKDLLGEVLRRLGRMEYSGNMTVGDSSNNISKKSVFEKALHFILKKTNLLYRYCVIYFNFLSIGMHALEYCRMYELRHMTYKFSKKSVLWACSARIVRALWNN